MIFDTLDNAGTYFNLSPRIQTALQFLRNTDLANLPLGKHAIDGDRIFAMAQQYTTKPPAQTFWEAHRKYIDVQYMHSGVEMMNYSPIERMRMVKEYDPEKEFMVLEGSSLQRIELSAGSYVIFMPHDAHMGGLQLEKPAPVHKIVLKVSVH